MKDIINAPFKWLEGFGVNTAWIMIAVAVFLMYFIFNAFDLASNRVFEFIFITLPVWLPVLTFLLFFEMWVPFVQKAFDLEAGRVTLEIRLPQEIMKSPEAMELIFTQLYQTASPDNHIQTYWDGKHPPKFSLELVSRGGNVSFYMNVPRKKFKQMTESQLYAQYPGIEIHELEIDYTAEIVPDLEKYFIFGFHYGLGKPDAYPIRTYFDFGLHTMPKEEEKVDPITVALETLGSIGPGEHMWLQILITANKKQNFKTGSLTATSDWKDGVKEEIKKIIGLAKERNEQGGMMQLTEGERGTIQAMERSLGKYAFNTNIRGLYIAEKEAANPGDRLGMLAGIFREYDDINRNQIGVKWRTDTDWPWWQDRKKKLSDGWKKGELNEYKKRTMNRRKFEKEPTFVLTTEELATIFHFPGKVALTPTLGRIPSARAEAPGNLPTG